MHQLGFVHRKDHKIPRQLITFSSGPATWALRQRCHQPLTPNHEAPLSQVVHLQHVPQLITKEARPDAWCRGFVQIVPFLDQLTALRSLELVHVPILTSIQHSVDILMRVILPTTQLQDLCLFNTGTLFEESFRMLRQTLVGLSGLRALQLNGVELQGAWFGDLWGLMMEHAHLTFLDISHNMVSSPHLTALPKCTAETLPLRELHLYENSLSDTMCGSLFSYFSAMRHLSMLDLRSNVLGFGSTMLCETLRQLKSLAELDVSQNNVTDKGAGLLAAALQPLTSLTRLDVSSNQLIGPVGFQALSALPCWPHNRVRFIVQTGIVRLPYNRKPLQQPRIC
jgi:hypothetical protein